ncbi:fibroblast growth factor receptor-like 1 [Rhipicephalus sanguineus]|uniref:fibroblast growth factor receptor-like 1 n=1 Tax=Rhipicephalus sanguineus TaxID=34632 RepID=UPI0020C206E5|nr:fibroblast growth factor receptor-like 1 [Rhipicephalus sanguineus]
MSLFDALLIVLFLEATALGLHVTARAAPADAPRVHPFAFSKDHQRGRTVAVTCIVDHGTPPFSFAWSKDGRPLPEAGGSEKPVSKMITESVSVLTVPNVDAEDVGNYTCRASNAAGSDGFTAELVVSGGC